jgi:hypothetical protein
MTSRASTWSYPLGNAVDGLFNTPATLIPEGQGHDTHGQDVPSPYRLRQSRERLLYPFLHHPAVIKTIFVIVLDRRFYIFNIFQWQPAVPLPFISGSARPSVSEAPNCTRTGTGLLCKAWASVMQTIKPHP